MKIKHFIIALLLIISIVGIYSFTDNYFKENTENDIYQEDQVTKVNAENYNKYTNNPYGYEIILLNTLSLNEDIISIKSRFESEEVVVDVLYDNFENTLDNFKIYNDYGNRSLKSSKDFKVTEEFNKTFNGINGYVLKYERKKINPKDRNFYATIALERTPTEVVTVFIKSSKPIDIEYIMPDFKFIAKTGEIKSNKIFKLVKKNFDILTQEFYNKYFINNEILDFGIFEPMFPASNENLEKLEDMLEYSFPVTLLYNTFELPYKKDQMHNAKNKGKVVEYTLYTIDKIDGYEKDITIDILEGKYDDYLEKLANGFNELDYPVLFRLNNEMNGSWVLYSSYNVGKDTDLYIECWKYIYNLFKEKGVNNLIFVWNPNELSFPNYAYNHYLNYYPGDEYVDIVGLTAYNTGNYYEGEIWRSFTEAYDHFYYEYEKQFEHPFMITEFSCATAGGNKVAWFDDMFNKITKYNKIKLAVLWNGQDFDMTKPEKTISRNYRLDLDEEVINVLKNRLKEFR